MERQHNPSITITMITKTGYTISVSYKTYNSVSTAQIGRLVIRLAQITR